MALLVVTLVGTIGVAFAKPPLEAFGDAPMVRSPDLSPDGKTIAYISRLNGMDYLAKYDIATGKNEPLIKLPEVRAGSLAWAGSNYIILRTSRTIPKRSYINQFEDTAAFAYNLTTRTFVQLLISTPGIYPYQSGLGRIVGIDPDGQSVYMPAYASRAGDSVSLNVLKVNLDTGIGERVPKWKGSPSTI